MVITNMSQKLFQILKQIPNGFWWLNLGKIFGRNWKRGGYHPLGIRGLIIDKIAYVLQLVICAIFIYLFFLFRILFLSQKY